MAASVQKASLDVFNASLVSQLECPVCLETCIPPIRMCIRAHVVCSNCATDLTKCPICREPMAPERCWFAEDISSKVKLPCKNAGSGCLEMFTLGEQETHLLTCSFKTYECLIGCDFVKGELNVCKWKGMLFELLDHVKEMHPGNYDCYDYYDDFTSDDESDIVMEPGITRVLSDVSKMFESPKLTYIDLLSFKGELFWCIVLIRPESKEVEFVALYIGYQEFALMHGYQFNIGGEDNMRKLAFSNNSVTLTLDESKDTTCKLSEYFVKLLSSPDDTLKYNLNIIMKPDCDNCQV